MCYDFPESAELTSQCWVVSAIRISHCTKTHIYFSQTLSLYYGWEQKRKIITFKFQIKGIKKFFPVIKLQVVGQLCAKKPFLFNTCIIIILVSSIHWKTYKFLIKNTIKCRHADSNMWTEWLHHVIFSLSQQVYIVTFQTAWSSWRFNLQLFLLSILLTLATLMFQFPCSTLYMCCKFVSCVLNFQFKIWLKSMKTGHKFYHFSQYFLNCIIFTVDILPISINVIIRMKTWRHIPFNRV